MKGYISFITGILLLLQACKTKEQAASIQTSKTVQIDSLSGSCPYLTNDTKGNIVLSWARDITDSTSVFCYAVSSDGGQTFGKPVSIPSSDNIHPHSENLPKIIFKPSGEIIALWGAANQNPKNKYSGLVYYSQSFDKGITWTTRHTLVTDTASYDQRYYDVALLPNGEAAIIWLDNRKTTDKEGSGLYFATTDGSKGFQNARMIHDGCCQCCRTRLYIDTKAGIHLLYRGIIKDSIRDMVHSVSIDGGKTFSEPKLISNDNWVIKGCPHTGPAMTENQQGLHFAWFTGAGDKGCFYTQSTNNGNSFDHRNQISTLGSHPQICTLPDNRIIIAWDEPLHINEKVYKKIGVQIRSAAGAKEIQEFITADTLSASYPVVIPANNTATLISYTLKKRDKNYVVYQQIKI